MRTLIRRIADLTDAGEFVAVATVVETVGSSPREVGASMALTQAGGVIGSLSGGCLEAEVLENAREVLVDGNVRLASYGPADSSELFAVGLTCGGVIDVVTRRFGPDDAAALGLLAQAIREERPSAVATVIDGADQLGGILVIDDGRLTGSLGSADLDHTVGDQLGALLAAGWTGTLHLGADGRRDLREVSVFVESFSTRPRMLIVGAIDAAEALTRVAKAVGYHTTVVDPRSTFATPERFPNADDVVVAWPHRLVETWPIDARSVVCVLTHDPRIDVGAILAALRARAGFVGAMGSTRTHFDRLERLRAIGATDAELEQLHSPIGLDIGAATPEEIAVSIVAEVIAARSGKTSLPMRESVGLRTQRAS